MLHVLRLLAVEQADPRVLAEYIDKHHDEVMGVVCIVVVVRAVLLPLPL